MDSPLFPAFAVVVGVLLLVLLGIIGHFLERDAEAKPEPAEHKGWEGEHEATLIDLVVEHGELTRITEDTARLRRDQLPGGGS